MCTSISLTTDGFYFGRNMDIDASFGERVVVTPRSYPFLFRRTEPLRSHLAMIGMAAVADGYPLYAEACNEAGLCMAGLSFPDNAHYPESEADDRANVAPFELIPWVLGQCRTVAEARRRLARTRVVRIPFSDALPLTPLHWHIADRRESIVAEPMPDGLRIWDNPVGVATNSPPFDFHLTNLRQYLRMSTAYPVSRFSGQIDLQPFGVGLGNVGLPGDFSPTSRFVKAAFLALNTTGGSDEASSLARFFHLLDAVAMPDGIVATPRGTFERTGYACCIHADRGVYYYKTYLNSCLTAVDMRREPLHGDALTQYPLLLAPQITHANAAP